MVCTFAGHRDVDSDIFDALLHAVHEAIIIYHVDTFLCGNKGQFDRLAAKAVNFWTKQYSNIDLVYVRAYLPASNDALPDYYTDSIYPEGLELVPKRYAIARRNQWMAKHCDIMISYVNYDWGGAYSTYLTAKKHEKIIINLGTL